MAESRTELARGVDRAHARLRTAAPGCAEEHRRLLWAVAYRITGSRDDADDVVQETFLRALENKTPTEPGELRRWLVRVATNASIDQLRRRRRRRYVGAWLPDPLLYPEAAESSQITEGESDPSALYELREGASYAFMIALEALTPQQRAVLVLRDILDYSAAEASQALGISEQNIRTTHHRARRAMANLPSQLRPGNRATTASARAALRELLRCLAEGDASALEQLLATGVRITTDSGGEFNALAAPMTGRTAVARLLLRTARRRRVTAVLECRINGEPAVIVDLAGGNRRSAPRVALRVELDASGMIEQIHYISSSAKLGAYRARP